MRVRPFCLSDDLEPGKGRYFPPRLEYLLAWSNLFRCKGTFANYLNYVRTGCMLVKASTKACAACGVLAWLVGWDWCAGARRSCAAASKGVDRQEEHFPGKTAQMDQKVHVLACVCAGCM